MRILYLFLVMFFCCTISYAKPLHEMSNNSNPDVNNDLIYSQDVSDTSESSRGTGKSLTIKNLLKAGNIFADGINVGIGSTNPTQKLDVSGTVKATAFIGDGSGLTGVAASASDVPYGPSWDGDATGIASKNAIYDKIETIGVTSNNWSKTDSNIHPSEITDNVSIGTSSSTAKLTVEGDIKATGNITSTGTGSNIEFNELSSDPDTPGVGKGKLFSRNNKHLYYIDSGGTSTDLLSGGGGSVTISTTSPMTGAGSGNSFTLGVDQSKLTLSNIGGSVTDSQVPNNITVDLAATAQSLSSDPSPCSSGNFVKDIAADGTLTCDTPAGGGGGGVGVGTVNPGTIGAIPKYTATTTVDDSSVLFEVGNNVGIGTSTPANLLDLQGTLTTARVVSTTTGGTSSGGAFTVAAKTAASMTADQRLGAFFFGGSTSAANGVQSAASLEGYAEGTWAAGSSAPSRFAFFTTPSGSLTRTERMRIDSTGNIGVGTISPNARITVFGSSTGAVPIETWKDSANTQRMVVMGNGTVGIGTSAPSNTLDVVGVVKATTFSGAGTNLTGTASSLTAGTVTTNANLTGDVTSSGNATTLNSAYKGWNDIGTILYNSTTSDQVAIGTITPVSGAALTVLGTMAGASTGPMAIMNANVGIGTTAPDSLLTVGSAGYMQFKSSSAGAPTAGDCDSDAERGRMAIDTTNNRLYVCNGATRAWDYVGLTD